jgi:redox-sensing transcriptional repressor
MAIDSVRVMNIPSIRRLPAYRRLLLQLAATGITEVSSTVIADNLDLDPIQVRKDLELTGIVGRPRVRYTMGGLLAAIDQYLGWTTSTIAVLVGVGHLGTALLGYQDFAHHGLRIVAAFDRDPAIAGHERHGTPVYAMERLTEVTFGTKAQIGVITVSAGSAQAVADALVRGEMRALWNFTPAALRVPDRVIVQNEDLSAGLAVLTRRVRQSANGAEAAAADRAQILN